MILLALALAATGMQLAEPTGHPGSWLTDGDYPRDAARKQILGQTRFKLMIGLQGDPLDCLVLVTSGNADLDQQTCAVLMRRAKFTPATASDGQPVFGTFTSNANWMLAGQFRMNKEIQNQDNSELQLTVSALPKPIKAPAKVRVGLLVKPDGTIAECRASETPNNIDTAAKLGKIACQQAMAKAKPKPLVNLQKEPVLSVQDMTVSFSIAP